MLTIGQVAHHAGLKTTTLRYYEEIGLLPSPARVSGQRRYDETVFRQLALIRLAQRAGFTLAEIRSLLHDFPEDAPPAERWHKLARPKLAEVQALIQRAEEMQSTLERMLDCTCESLAQCSPVTELPY
jgi:redox-sensitive transcriptional activator SoxR